MPTFGKLSLLFFLAASAASVTSASPLDGRALGKRSTIGQKILSLEKREIQGGNGRSGNDEGRNENEAEDEAERRGDDQLEGLPTDPGLGTDLPSSSELGDLESGDIADFTENEDTLPLPPASLIPIIDQQARYMAMLHVPSSMYVQANLATYLLTEVPYLSVYRAERIAYYVINALQTMDQSGRLPGPTIDEILDAQLDSLDVSALEQQMDVIVSFIEQNLNLANGPPIGDWTANSQEEETPSPFERLTKLADNQARLLAILKARRGDVSTSSLAGYLREQNPFMGFEDAVEMAEISIEEHAPVDEQRGDDGETPSLFGRLGNWWSRVSGRSDRTDDAAVNDEEGDETSRYAFSGDGDDYEFGDGVDDDFDDDFDDD